MLIFSIVKTTSTTLHHHFFMSTTLISFVLVCKGEFMVSVNCFALWNTWVMIVVESLKNLVFRCTKCLHEYFEISHRIGTIDNSTSSIRETPFISFDDTCCNKWNGWTMSNITSTRIEVQLYNFSTITIYLHYTCKTLLGSKISFNETSRNKRRHAVPDFVNERTHWYTTQILNTFMGFT